MKRGWYVSEERHGERSEAIRQGEEMDVIVNNMFQSIEMSELEMSCHSMLFE